MFIKIVEVNLAGGRGERHVREKRQKMDKRGRKFGPIRGMVTRQWEGWSQVKCQCTRAMNVGGIER